MSVNVFTARVLQVADKLVNWWQCVIKDDNQQTRTAFALKVDWESPPLVGTEVWAVDFGKVCVIAPVVYSPKSSKSNRRKDHVYMIDDLIITSSTSADNSIVEGKVTSGSVVKFVGFSEESGVDSGTP